MGDNFMPENADNHMPKLNDHICSTSIPGYTNQLLPNDTNGYNGVTNGYMSSIYDTFHCEKCNFKSNHQEQFNVFHIDGSLENCQFNNLKTICANCQRIMQKEGVRWKQGDLLPDF